MGFKGDKSIVYTKNKFEQFLNTSAQTDILLSLEQNELLVLNTYDKSKQGTVLRRKFKLQFDRLYLIWLNTK